MNSFDEWIKHGYDQGWVGPAVCFTHDGFPTSEEEDDSFDNGNDPCMHVIRLYEDMDHKSGVEENHSASVWRASNQGLRG